MIVCTNINCPCHNPRSFWVEIDVITGNPTGQICWAYYSNDRPQEGNWILVSEKGPKDHV